MIFNNNTQDFDFRVGAVGIGAALFVEGSSGNVGIGTDSPTFALEIDGGTGDANDNALKVISGHGATGKAVHIQTNSGSTEALTIQGNGNVGIGTAVPSTLLHLDNGGASNSGTVNTLRLANPGTQLNDGAKIVFTAGSSTDGAGIASRGKALDSADLAFFTGGSNERLTIDTSGNVGIGTSSPTVALDVIGGIQLPAFTQLRFGSASYSIEKSSGSFYFSSYSSPITFNSSNGENMRIDYDTGNVGIGTTSPAYLLDCDGDVRLGSSASDSIGLYDATPTAQHSASGNYYGFTPNTGTPVLNDSGFQGSSASGTSYTISDIVTALKNIGIMAT
jgi:hypothetical protein